MAIRATIYLAAMGKTGFAKVANLCFQKAHYAAEQISMLDGYEIAFDTPFFNEFVVRCTKISVEKVLSEARRAGILAGVALERWYPEFKDCLLVAVTEKRTKSEIDQLVKLLKTIAKE